MGNPKAAKGTFPYPHRTVAEVWSADDHILAACLASANGPGSLDRRIGEPGAPRFVRGHLSTLPTSPCPLCGARGWCGHSNRVAA